MKKIIYILIFIIVIISIILIVNISSNNTLEDKLIDEVKLYLKNNNINNNFISLKDLNLSSEFNDCNQNSGVLIENDNYYAYIVCNNYITSINDEKLLDGDEIMIINNNEDFIDPNSKAKVSSNLKKSNGIYTINYQINNKTLTRKVIVTDNKLLNFDNKKSTRYPTLTLNGKDVKVFYKETYMEPGYMANDTIDGNITNNVITTGEVLNEVGNYKINYFVSNSKGNYINVSRNVSIVKKEISLDINLSLTTNEYTDKLSIIVSINGDGYQKTILPTQEETTNNNFFYEVKENGRYVFTIIDSNDEITYKEINVSNIDVTKPTGTCSATLENSKITFKVDANDNGKIKEYQYNVDNSNQLSDNPNYIYSGTFRYSSKPKVSVTIRDMALNETTITCQETDKLEPTIYTDSNGYQCLEGYTCYHQKDYNDRYQATSSGIGTISSSGCLPTAMATIVTKFDKRSKDGNLYNPSTLVNEVIYKNGKVWGYSNYSRVQYIVGELNLKVSEMHNRNETEVLKNHLRTGNPIVFNVNGGCYSTGAHYVAILGINSKDEIFISDPYSKTNKSMTKECTVNDWSPIDEFVKKGGVTYFALISE